MVTECGEGGIWWSSTARAKSSTTVYYEKIIPLALL